MVSDNLGVPPPHEIIYTEYVMNNGQKDVDFDEEMALACLLMNSVVFVNSSWWEKPPRKDIDIFVNCNDIFGWACADAEMLNLEDLQDLYMHWHKDKSFGPAVWCAKKRHLMPKKPVEKLIRQRGIWDLDSMGLTNAM